MYVQADYRQIVGEVKERNRFFNSLKEIRNIALLSSGIENLEECKKRLRSIVEKCDRVFDEII